MKFKNLIKKSKVDLTYKRWLNQFLKASNKIRLNQVENNPNYFPIKGA